MTIAELREVLPRERRGPVLVLLVRWQRSYTQLSVTAEAPATAALDTKAQIAQGKATSSPPSRQDGAADRARAELEGWAYRMVRDPDGYDHDLARLRTLCAQVEEDLRLRLHQAPGRGPETEKERDRRCLKDYEGIHYADAAVQEGCSGSWFRKLRQLNKRDQRYGKPLVKQGCAS